MARDRPRGRLLLCIACDVDGAGHDPDWYVKMTMTAAWLMYHTYRVLYDTS